MTPEEWDRCDDPPKMLVYLWDLRRAHDTVDDLGEVLREIEVRRPAIGREARRAAVELDGVEVEVLRADGHLPEQRVAGPERAAVRVEADGTAWPEQLGQVGDRQRPARAQHFQEAE